MLLEKLLVRILNIYIHHILYQSCVAYKATLNMQLSTVISGKLDDELSDLFPINSF